MVYNMVYNMGYTGYGEQVDYLQIGVEMSSSRIILCGGDFSTSMYLYILIYHHCLPQWVQTKPMKGEKLIGV